MSESQQKKLSRVRPPRVHLTYDVEKGDAVVKTELPFVMGVLGDFSGNPTEPLKSLRDRKFVNIDRDNFDEVMSKLNAGLDLRVKNTLTGDGEMSVHLDIRSMKDFDPEQIVQQIAPLSNLLEVRNQLRDLLTQIGMNADLEETLDKILQDAENTKKLAEEVGAGAPAGDQTSEPETPSEGGEE